MEFVEYLFIALAYIAVVGFLLSGLDDLIFDSQFLVYLWRQRKRPHISLQDLRSQPEQWIAIFVPAWMEGNIVNKMADYASRVLLYEKYDIFIGVYPNDPETIQCVTEICARNPRVHKVLVPHAGPTCKADCLNWIYRAMQLNEVPGTREYKLICLHDAEDVLHPLLLKVYNYFIPKTYDMGQVPVFALELPALKYWTGNTYIDDFSELHTKDLFVREGIGGIVPSAGVGTVFSRESLDKLAGENQGEPFRLGNLTEDYEVGIRIKRGGFRAGVLSVPVDRLARTRKKDGSPGPLKTVTETVAVRECFPNTFRTAVRQRSRWILGISFQTWEQTGWEGTWPMRYTLLRDRRAPLTHLINMVGYLVLLYALVQWVFRNTGWAQTVYLRPIFIPDSLLWKIVIVDTWLLAYRSLQKFMSVLMIYSFKQALFSIPRTVLGNLINFTATARAAKMYLMHRFFGKPIVWLKTAHVFPTEAELAEYRETIEDLLVEEGLVTREQILQALQLEKSASAPLALLRMGLLQEKDFTDAWARFSKLPVRWIDASEVPLDVIEKFPESQSLKWEAMPVAKENGDIVVSFREPPGGEALRQLSEQLGAPLRPYLTRPSSISWARARAYPQLVLPPSRTDAAWEVFRAATRMEPQTFLATVSEHYAARQSLADTLGNAGVLAESEARRLWAETIGYPPLDVRSFSPFQKLYFEVGPTFWWIHRLYPISALSIATGQPVHPALKEWLANKMGAEPNFVAELPGKIEWAFRKRGVELDPDQILIDSLVAKGILKSAQIPELKSMRKLITDPLPNWLRMQKFATDEQLHTAFRELSYLPPAEAWQAEEVERLEEVLAPGFALEHGCYCLVESGGAIRIGLSQMPSMRMLQEIQVRLGGYPVIFQALSFEEAVKLGKMNAEK
jgi:bacteriophage N4 adsorption protein B